MPSKVHSADAICKKLHSSSRSSKSSKSSSKRVVVKLVQEEEERSRCSAFDVRITYVFAKCIRVRGGVRGFCFSASTV